MKLGEQPRWRRATAKFVWVLACAEAIGLLAIYLIAATVGASIHFTYFASKIGSDLLFGIAIICLASLVTFPLSFFASGKRRFMTALMTLGILGFSLLLLEFSE